jgi:hypothetical protein
MLYSNDPLLPLNMGRSNHFAKSAVSTLPAIVLPVVPEQLSVGGHPRDGFVDDGHQRVMRETWAAFETLVREAPEIVAIGYSLPGTDARAIDVLSQFTRGINARSQPKRLLIVDPDRRVVERFHRLVCPHAQHVCDDFSEFDPETI